MWRHVICAARDTHITCDISVHIYITYGDAVICTCVTYHITNNTSHITGGVSRSTCVFVYVYVCVRQIVSERQCLRILARLAQVPQSQQSSTYRISKVVPLAALVMCYMCYVWYDMSRTWHTQTRKCCERHHLWCAMCYVWYDMSRTWHITASPYVI